MNILLSFLGTTLDSHGRGKRRWNVWRPSVALAMQNDIAFDEYHIIHSEQHAALARDVMADIATVSPSTRIIPHVISFKDAWDFEEVYAALYDLSQRLDFRPGKHRHYIHITTGTHVAQICLFLLNESRHLPGELIQTLPAPRGPAPQGRYVLINLDLSKYDQLSKRFAAERLHDLDFLKSGIATRNLRFNALIETIERVTLRSVGPMLLTGPTGAGKSQLARRIHELKKRNRLLAGPFIEVNCATLRGDMAMPALFGHTKGAFTGATAARPGLLKAADQGILFLDEIGELRADEQAMLLRAIEEKTFIPVGADHETRSDFQLICGTNRDLAAAVRQGRFRDDLLARINLWHFELPGLADRREDIAPNLDYELDQLTRKTGRRISINREARARFLAYALSSDTPWHGNFRELNAMMTRMATLAPDGRIDTATVNAELARVVPNAAPAADDDDETACLAALLGADYAQRHDRFDLVQLAEVLRVARTAATLSEAGRILFAASRRHKKTSNDTDRLRKYLLRFNLKWDDLKSLPDA